jgi:putative transcriptional regulator
MKTNFDIEKVAAAVEKDAGQAVPGLRESLAQANAGTFARITTPEQMLVRQARSTSGLTQEAFANLIGTPCATLRDWEQGRFAPPGGVVCLLRLLNKRPELMHELAP